MCQRRTWVKNMPQTSKASFNTRMVAELFKQELCEMFNQWERSKPLRTGAPHASAILQTESDWCLRRQVLLSLYPEEAKHPEVRPWTALENQRFLNGWYIHEKYQRLFTEHGQVIEVEHSHYDETRYLHFTPDAVVSFGGEVYVVEIKGYRAEKKDDKPDSSSTIWERLDETKNPPKSAWHQCNLYCHLLGIERGLVVVENKNTQEVKVWCIQHDPTLAKPYTDRMYKVKGAVACAAKGQGIPARACKSMADDRASKCPVRDFCFSGRLEK